jgi:hypothetical protein
VTTESEFIDTLRKLATDPAARELRDDAAVLELDGMRLVVSHDMLVEGVHYRRDDPAGDVAWKLVAVNLSDLDLQVPGDPGEVPVPDQSMPVEHVPACLRFGGGRKRAHDREDDQDPGRQRGPRVGHGSGAQGAGCADGHHRLARINASAAGWHRRGEPRPP